MEASGRICVKTAERQRRNTTTAATTKTSRNSSEECPLTACRYASDSHVLRGSHVAEEDGGAGDCPRVRQSVTGEVVWTMRQIFLAFLNSGQ